MKLPCQAERLPGGDWRVRHASTTLGSVEVKAATRDEAMHKMRRELHYRLEICPCTGETYKDVEIEIVEG